MTLEKIKLMPKPTDKKREAPKKLAYWRSSSQCFSIDYKGIITEICKGDLGYGDMDPDGQCRPCGHRVQTKRQQKMPAAEVLMSPNESHFSRFRKTPGTWALRSERRINEGGRGTQISSILRDCQF
jgi:hypothetical protein